MKNRERLVNAKLADGASIEIVELPMPDPVYYQNRRLPASYANFYIANKLVLVPAFGCPQDTAAREIISECFVNRDVVSVDCRSILVGLGAVHCLTQQVPWTG
jgi:agmatine deiminase